MLEVNNHNQAASEKSASMTSFSPVKGKTKKRTQIHPVFNRPNKRTQTLTYKPEIHPASSIKNPPSSNQGRALRNALAINAAERDGRLPIVTSANCLQPDGQDDNGWNQGLLFLNQSNVWLQPPGYVTKLNSENYEPLEVWSKVTDPNNNLDATAERSRDGNQLVPKVVNPGSKLASAGIILDNYSPRQFSATVETLDGPLNLANSAKSAHRVHPIRTKWQTHCKNGRLNFDFPPHSISIIKFGQKEKFGS